MNGKSIYGPVTRLRQLTNKGQLITSSRPTASEVISKYISKRGNPHWTSFFIRYSSITNDHYGLSTFNWNVNDDNYQILRTGCFPFIKYHCTKRPYTDFTWENRLFTSLKVINLGIPTFAYGVAATFLIKHVDSVETSKGKIEIYFLYPEDPNARY